MPLFLRVFVVVAAGLLALVVLAFVLKLLIVAAVVTALIVVCALLAGAVRRKFLRGRAYPMHRY